MTTETKFTPGPWRLFNGTDVFLDDGDTSGDHYIADCNMTVAIEYGVLKANAALIAAAPDLYAALDAVVNAGGWYPSALEIDTHDGKDGEELEAIARAALAKARGEA